MTEKPSEKGDRHPIGSPTARAQPPAAGPRLRTATDCRLLIDPPAPGAWNMAVDEVLLDWSAETGGCAWRFYRWSEPTLSLGYFQCYDDRQSHAASRNCAVVRRASGGGAILHDAELTYSIVVPLAHPLAGRRRALYDAVHTTLIEVLEQCGVTATLCRVDERAIRSPQPFLCFQRRAEGDVLVGGAKVAGSAQRRNHGAVLQHGSVLLRRSAAAPELEGLDGLAPRAVNEGDLLDQWADKLAQQLSLAWQPKPLNENERARAAALVRDKYGSEGWLRRKGRQHD